MAAGTTTWFAAYLEKVFDEQVADFGTTPNTIKCALIKSAANGGHDPSASDPHPTWGSGGSTDLSASEVSTSPTYLAGGNVCANPTSARVSNVFQLDWENPASWGQDGANPTNARWAIFYDDTASNKECICFMDLGADRDMTAGELLIAMGTPALTGTC